MRISVCDDENVFLKEIKNKLYEYSNVHNWESVVDTYDCGFDLINSDTKYDIIILDYQMDKINGLDTAKQLRKGINKNSCLIFLTGYAEIAIPAYNVDTYRFVLKSSLYGGLFKALDSYRKTLDSNFKICIKADGEHITINTNKIVYIEVQDKLCRIYLTNEKFYDTRQTLSCLYGLLPQAVFFKIHRSYIVNLKYIKQYNNSTVIPEFFDCKLPISRTYFSKFCEKYYEFLRDS